MPISPPDAVVCVTDFADAAGQVRRLRFSQPRLCLAARHAHEVLPLLQQVDSLTRQGAWAVGYLAYEAAAGLDAKLAASMPIAPDQPQPLLAFAIFDGPDQEMPANPALQAALATEKRRDNPACQPLSPVWQFAEDAATYTQAITRIRQSIAAGDVYQVNHTLRIRAEAPATASHFSLWHYYEALRQRQQAGYCAWLDWDGWQVLSLSPELFFDWNRTTGQISTRPMKGTAPRGGTAEEDQTNAQALQASPKERAENVMIVDLLRNDLGRVAVTGSVQTPALFQTEPYPTLWQMTSTVQAVTRPEIGLPALLQALFPCGSITGAPKRKAVEMIAALETAPRGVYCGAVGLISPCRAVFNVAIRTVHATADGALQAGVGGGITWSSEAAAEYAEARLKARFLDTPALPSPDFGLLETLLLVDGRYALLPYHLRRLCASAAAWNFRPVSDAQRMATLHDFARQRPTSAWRVRLVQSPDGALSATGTLLGAQTPPELSDWSNDALAPACWLQPPAWDYMGGGAQTVAMAPLPNAPADLPWLQHKTTRRSHYAQASAAQPQAWDVLLYSSDGHATETTRGNLVLHSKGQWLTPAIGHGMLPGTLRAALLERGLIREAALPVQRIQNLQAGESLWFINSVRGWVRLDLQAGDQAALSDKSMLGVNTHPPCWPDSRTWSAA